MKVLRKKCIWLAALVLALVMVGAPAQAQYATFPMVPGEMAVTCFSGLLQNSQPFPHDPDGPVLAVIDGRIPPVDVLSPIPVLDTNWNALAYHNELGNAGHEWTAENLGQVFGIAIDDADPPNIYTTATTLYGLFPAGPGGDGAVYRIDGTTGDICTIAQLPNTGPALGNVCYDAESRSLFVSNFEDGLIYRVALDSGDPLNPCDVDDAVAVFDHGVDGRPVGAHPDTGATLTAMPDDPSVDFTPAGRRVWGLQPFEGRLYYGVWAESYPHQVWSVALDGAGGVVPGSAYWEAVQPIGSTIGQPISDIAFSDAGNMFIAERTMNGDYGGLHQGGGSGAHASRVLKFEGAHMSWTLSVEEYNVGALGQQTNSAGGVDVDCEENVWASGDALHYQSATGHTDLVYGWQWIAAGGNAGDPATLNSYLIGVNGGGFFKYQIGDVELYEEPCACMEIEEDRLECDPENPGEVIYSFDVTNLSGIDAARVLLTPTTPGLTISPNVVDVFVADGATENLTVSLSGYNPDEEVCFIVTLLSEDGYACCSQEVCLEVPPCDCLAFVGGKLECDPDNPGSYIISFLVTNLTSDTLEHLYIFPDAGLTVTPNYFDVPSVGPGGTTPAITFNLDGGFPGDEVCLLISVHDERLEQCCAVEKCFTLPDCCDGDQEKPVIELLGDTPQEVECGADFTPPRAIATDDCDGQLQVMVEGSIDTSVPGLQCITYTATDSSGNVASITYCVTVSDDCCNPDDDPPVLDIGLAPAEVDCNGQWPAPTVSAFDDCDGEVEVKVEGEVDTSKPGEYCITYTATDSSGNSVSETICVTVLDNCCDPDTLGPEIIFLTPFPATIDCGASFPYPEVLGRDNCDEEVQVAWEGTIDTSTPGVQCITYTATDSSGNTTSVTECVEVLNNCEGEPVPGAFHSADRNKDARISLSELLRVIQFFSQGGYHCDTTTEDGFAPGVGSHDGARHDCDYNVEDWVIDLFELIRLVQLFNAGGYHPCEMGEDAFCPGPAS